MNPSDSKSHLSQVATGSLQVRLALRLAARASALKVAAARWRPTRIRSRTVPVTAARAGRPGRHTGSLTVAAAHSVSQAGKGTTSACVRQLHPNLNSTTRSLPYTSQPAARLRIIERATNREGRTQQQERPCLSALAPPSQNRRGNHKPSSGEALQQHLARSTSTASACRQA